ncbi:MAG TPA: cytochrome c oxidase subunit 3 [Bryobacteraceae bacterium]|jgi:cytochrome c oxidase subunit 3|nr:cytochrome c oxidase subunit 3 [Bryobacteraceae bacterium]
MARTLTESNRGGPPPILPDLPPGDPGGEDRDRSTPGNSRQTSITGIIVLMCASAMTFAAFVSAMVVRRGLNNDWGQIGLPHILYWNTGVLLLSSVAIDAGRRLLRSGSRAAFNWVWSAGTLLGITFLAGQAIAWKQLEERGFYISGHPSSAFFYVLTWAHAAHVVGALAAVMYVEYRALRFELGPSRRTMVTVTAIFWHFLDVLWLGIMGLFVFWA